MRQCLLLVVLLFTAGYCALAQGSCWDCNLDSLKQQLSLKTGKERFELLKLLIDFDPLGTSQGPDVLSRYNELVELNNKLRLIEITPYIKLKEAKLLDENKDYVKALDYFNQAIDLFDKQKKLIYWLLWQPRYFYNKMNKPEEGYHYYEKKLEYYLVIGPLENTAACYESLGRYSGGKADYNQSISNYLKGAEIARTYSNKMYAILMTGVAMNYQQCGNEEKSLHYARLILPMALAVKPRMPVAYQLAIVVNKEKKDFQTALRYADAAIEQSLHIDSNTSYFNSALVRDYTNKAVLYLEMQQTALAYPLLVKANQYIDSAESKTRQPSGFPETDFAWYQYKVQTQRPAQAEGHLLKVCQASLAATNPTLKWRQSKAKAHRLRFNYPLN